MNDVDWTIIPWEYIIEYTRLMRNGKIGTEREFADNEQQRDELLEKIRENPQTKRIAVFRREVEERNRPLIVHLTEYVGDTTSLKIEALKLEAKNIDCDDLELDDFQNHMYMIVDSKTGAELDNGYRSFEEAVAAWPNALNVGRSI